MEEEKQRKRPGTARNIVVGLIATVFIIGLIVLGIGIYDAIFRPPPVPFNQPLGLSQLRNVTGSIKYIVADAPEGAYVTGTEIFLTHEGEPAEISSVNLYYANSTLAASYNHEDNWEYHNGATADTLEFNPGMTLYVIAPSFSSGDIITFSSVEDFYGTTTLTVH